MISWILSLLGLGPKPPPAAPTPAPVPPQAAYFDDFVGPRGTVPKIWQPDIGATASPPSAKTDYPRNAQLDGAGNWTLTAIKETLTKAQDKRLPYTVNYTTPIYHTKGTLERQYGTWQARIYFPAGTGHHPTFYLFGADYDFAKLNWPACGEIDVMELQGTVQGSSIHGPGYDWVHGTQISVKAPLDVRGGWHTYSCIHQENKITIRVDNTLLKTFTPADLPKGKAWVFNKPMFAWMDLSLGSTTNAPTATTPFPIEMLIDWFRYDPL